MLTRRDFLYRTAGAAALMPVRPPHAPRYDLAIVNGRVLDPASKLDRIADVGILNGRIAAVQSRIAAADAAAVVDARDQLVTPGLVDIHAHASVDMPPAHCLSTGVTSMIDAGSAGADNIAELVALARAAPNRVRILVNLGRTGLGGRGELLDFANADAAAARRAIEAHRDVVVGIKARLSANVVGDR